MTAMLIFNLHGKRRVCVSIVNSIFGKSRGRRNQLERVYLKYERITGVSLMNRCSVVPRRQHWRLCCCREPSFSQVFIARVAYANRVNKNSRNCAIIGGAIITKCAPTLSAMMLTGDKRKIALTCHAKITVNPLSRFFRSVDRYLSRDGWR